MEDLSRKKQIGSILGNLMHSARFSRDEGEQEAPHGSRLTSFGVPLLEQGDGSYLIDMTAMKIFSGIPAFVSFLAGEVLEQCRRCPHDILCRTLVDPDNTPELADLGISHVMVYARAPVARRLLEDQAALSGRLRLIFDAVQTPRWGGILFPRVFLGSKAAGSEETALLFPFHAGNEVSSSYYILLEYDPVGRFLRLTVEDGGQSRLFLKRIPHRVVGDVGRRHYRQDIAVMAEQIFTGIHRECQNQRNEYLEIPGRQAALFELLVSSGLENVTGAVFRWTPETSERLLLSGDEDFSLLLAKILLLLEDDGLVKILACGGALEMIHGDCHTYIDLSRKGAVVNISIGEPRQPPDMEAHLRRMPHLRCTATAAPGGLLKDFRILLVHHATSEVLGFVKALDAARCGFLSTLFIRYQGVIPDFYIEDMLSLTEERFIFYALQRIELRDSVNGAYILSRQFSSLEGLQGLDHALRRLRGDYLESMRLAAGHLFFREAFAAREEGRRLLLIEDGGYLAPPLNRFCSESRSLAETLALFAFEPPPGADVDIDLGAWLGELLPATFEHTTNGYQQLAAVARECRGLTFPALTIATSRYKNVVEAEACAYSIISAVESIFNGLGKSLLHRHALVLGSRGNIGRFVLKGLADRGSYGKVCGLDLRATEEGGGGRREYPCVAQLGEEIWKPLDLFIGMTGVSVLKADFFERLVLEGTARELFFASGSTKTVEFADLFAWLEGLAAAPRPVIGGRPVRLEKRLVKDPQNSGLQGHRVRIVFEEGGGTGDSGGECWKDIYLLGFSMPINFLYYGVPGEVIDGVFEELFSLVCGFVLRQRAGKNYPPAIYGVDRNVDKQGIPYRKDDWKTTGAGSAHPLG